MTLAQDIVADLPTFLNVDEFGQTSTVGVDDYGGVAAKIVMQADEDSSPDEADGIENLESTVFVRAADLPALPVVRSRMVIDGQKYDVRRVDQQQGMLVIRLRWLNS